MPKAGERRIRKKFKENASARIASWPSTHDRIAKISVESGEQMAQILDWIVRDLDAKFKDSNQKEWFFNSRKPTNGIK